MRMGAIVLDSDNADLLAGFYQELLGWKQERPDDEWIIVASGDNTGTPLVFQQVDGYQRPVWPAEPNEQQQMLHLDFYVEAGEFEKEVARAISLGAHPAATQLSNDWMVLLDPEGHPFCIIPIPPVLP